MKSIIMSMIIVTSLCFSSVTMANSFGHWMEKDIAFVYPKTVSKRLSFNNGPDCKDLYERMKNIRDAISYCLEDKIESNCKLSKFLIDQIGLEIKKGVLYDSYPISYQASLTDSRNGEILEEYLEKNNFTEGNSQVLDNDADFIQNLQIKIQPKKGSYIDLIRKLNYNSKVEVVKFNEAGIELGNRLVACEILSGNAKLTGIIDHKFHYKLPYDSNRITEIFELYTKLVNKYRIAENKPRALVEVGIEIGIYASTSGLSNENATDILSTFFYFDTSKLIFNTFKDSSELEQRMPPIIGVKNKEVMLKIEGDNE